MEVLQLQLLMLMLQLGGEEELEGLELLHPIDLMEALVLLLIPAGVLQQVRVRIPEVLVTTQEGAAAMELRTLEV
jgi:hypothetical protein